LLAFLLASDISNIFFIFRGCLKQNRIQKTLKNKSKK